jgi:hypothetical protein
MTFATRLRPRYRAISQNIGKTFDTRKASLPGGIRCTRARSDKNNAMTSNAFRSIESSLREAIDHRAGRLQAVRTHTVAADDPAEGSPDAATEDES